MKRVFAEIAPRDKPGAGSWYLPAGRQGAMVSSRIACALRDVGQSPP